MISLIVSAMNTKKFIENYPGSSTEEKNFMRKIKERCRLRNEYIQRNTVILLSLGLVPALLVISKKRLPRWNAVAILITTPITVYWVSKLVPFIDFATSLDVYKKEILKSELPLTQIFRDEFKET